MEEDQQRRQPNRMLEFLGEENGCVFSPLTARPPSRPRRCGSQAATRRVAPTPTHVEKALPSGDYYRDSVPHGAGKYLWSDGCVYERKSKFPWPSGASFEGEFGSGRNGGMEGFGVFAGSDGDSYRGQWVADRKHGYGRKLYANADSYEGGWRRNVQDGEGRYVWRNGNQYIGEWKNGVISGRGVFIWANGNRYSGQWENGVPKSAIGGGVFTWPDGSCYTADSSPSSSSQPLQGTLYPSTNPLSSSQWPVTCKVADSMDASSMEWRGSYAGKNFPRRICIWDSDGDAGDITCDIIDTIEDSLLCKGGFDKVVAAMEAEEEQKKQQRWNPWCFIGGGEQKKPGNTISKGHKNYDLMRNLQLGISYSVGKSVQMRELNRLDFNPKAKFSTRFPPQGSKITPPHHSTEFRWKDYCPMVFRHLRELFAVDPADYMLAICGNEALRELSSPGKSGSFFYLTQDDRFMIKTVRKSEVKVLIRMLPSYYKHVSQHRNSLVTKFFGFHCVKPIDGRKVRFVVIGNLFCSEHRIHRRFDLKGSTYGRTTDKTEREIDETTTLKDLDLNFVFHLQHPYLEDLLLQVDKDCEFLEAEGIMDYSLLIGLHVCDGTFASKLGVSSGNHKILVGFQDIDHFLDSRKSSIRLGANMPARAQLVSRSKSDDDDDDDGIYGVILYFGIIDILQDYNISKKMEHAYKSLHVDPNSISAVDPKLYSKRFRGFIQRIFLQDQ